jgi:type IV pilus assembly protein PilM
VQQRCGVSFEQAETFKIEGMEDAQQTEELRESLVSYADPILMEIERSIDYFRSTSTGEYISRIYLSGGGAKVPGIATDLYQRLNIEVEVVDPFKKIELGKKLAEQDLPQSVGPVAAVGIGLALRRMGDR